MRRAVLIVTLLVTVAACGSRTSSSGESDALGGSSTTAGGGGSSVPTPESEQLGSMENPCSDGPLDGTTPEGAEGVTDTEIRIGVISDRENETVPLPTVGIEEAVEAFVAFCNAAGGINGREIVLETYDSKISAVEAATTEACRAGLLALVGTGSVQDQQGIATREDCGLIEVAGYTATADRAQSELLWQPIPGQADGLDVGPCLHLAEQFPDAVKKAAIIATDLPAATERADALVAACEAEAGFDFVVDRAQSFGNNDFRSIVADMKAQGVTYLTMVSSASELAAVLDEVETQGLELEVLDLGQQYYDAAVAADPLADGAWVVTGTIPFSETDQTPMLGLYRDWLAEIGVSEDRATALGAQSFSAGFLFATAAAAAGAELTRATLAEQLDAVTEWDGGGLHARTSPPTDEASGCFLYMRLTDGAFVREHPESGFSCDPSHVITR